MKSAKIKKLVSVVLCMAMLAAVAIPCSAATQIQLIESYGFEVPDSGYSYITYFENPLVMNVYTSGGVLIGSSTTVLARARSTTTDGAGRYYDTFFVRSQMDPEVTKSGSTYYRGLNFKNEAKMSLHSNQTYVNIAPMGTMPESSSTWDISFAGSASGKDFGFQIDTGYSSTVEDFCVTVDSNYTTSDKTYDVLYEYSASSYIISTAARRAANKWCTQSHQCFYAFTYRTPSSNTENMTITFYNNFRYAKNSTYSWDGSTHDVAVDTSGRSITYTVEYLNSN